MKSYNQTKNNSLYFKKFNFYDLILKIILISAAFIVFLIFISILFYVIFRGAFYITPKLFYNVSNGIQKGILPIIINTVYLFLYIKNYNQTKNNSLSFKGEALYEKL